MSPAWRADENGVKLFVRVTPGAKKNEISGLWKGAGGETRLAVKVTAPPDKGKANDAVIKLLAKALDAPKSSFSVASGAASRLKTIEFVGAPEALCARLHPLAETLQNKT